MVKANPNNKYKIMNDLSLAVSMAAEKPVYFEKESEKQIKQDVANKFIRENLVIKKHKYYKVDERVKVKHFHITKDAIVLVGDRYIYINSEKYFSFDDIDINERVVSAWFLSEADAKLF